MANHIVLFSCSTTSHLLFCIASCICFDPRVLLSGRRVGREFLLKEIQVSVSWFVAFLILMSGDFIIFSVINNIFLYVNVCKKLVLIYSAVSMYYRSPICIDAKIGNNVFAYEKRMQSLGEAKIFVPALVDGTLDDVLLGESIVFAEMDDNDIKLCYGLRDIVRLSDRHCPIYIMDNHNHALYCRYKEYIA